MSVPFDLPRALQQPGLTLEKLHQYWLIIDFVHRHFLHATGTPRKYIEVADLLMDSKDFRQFHPTSGKLTRKLTPQLDEDLMFSGHVYEWMVAMLRHGVLAAAMASIEELRRPSIGGPMALENSQIMVYNGFVRSEHEFRTLTAQYKAMTNEPADCPGFPTGDDQGQKALVKELYDALMDCDQETLHSLSKAGRKKSDRAQIDPAEVAGTAYILRLKDVERELLCWEILFATRDMQMKNAYVPGWSISSFKYKRFASFSERWAAIVSLLRKSKAVVKEINKAPLLKRMVANPEVEAERRDVEMSERTRY
ncbi:hypothetical protein B0H67DRAFT_255421 [Lasiosphaeris hirsuta]|uniref:Uncharacterized protein n=1 Tax=Lasiosphaeris hirsuta TaxID=260670 RepID=A0AA40DWB0_9PEZI|nr:hypothetical protein B0H67DRAFT_255421 [Lasiosphaeris hirsuta]